MTALDDVSDDDLTRFAAEGAPRLPTGLPRRARFNRVLAVAA